MLGSRSLRMGEHSFLKNIKKKQGGLNSLAREFYSVSIGPLRHCANTT